MRCRAILKTICLIQVKEIKEETNMERYLIKDMLTNVEMYCRKFFSFGVNVNSWIQED